MRSFVSLAAAVALAGGISIGAQSAQAVSFGFEVLEDNSPIDLSGQLFVEVLDAGGGLVSFEFQNLGPLASSIARIYFHDMNGDIDPPLTIPVLGQSPGVSFSVGSASPGELPGAENATPEFVTTSELLMDANPPPGGESGNGINPGEWLLVLANAVFDFDSIISALTSGELRIGLHVISLSDEESETYITNPTPIPLPAGLLLFLSGLAGVGFLGRYKARRRETAAA